MQQHIVVDGSNIATEGRSLPSLKQLDEAVRAFTEEHPDALITVVVDATFGHRIDKKEVEEFDEAISNNELVAPPAGAVGRGDAFVLSIANKVGAMILSNDSYQEFHGQYPWLFDEGRLIGGKPVPHIGWVFVPRNPVRGPLSRKSIGQAKRTGRGERSERSERSGAKRQASPEASQPMPVPSAPPPNASLARKPKPAVELTPAAPAAASARKSETNELLPYLSFVERHPLGTAVAAVVDRYSSHGAYVSIDGVVGYLGLRLMSDPPPRSAREFVQLGETISLVVESYAPARRSIDLATPAMATARPPAAVKRAARKSTKKAAPAVEVGPEAEVAPPSEELAAPAKKPTRKRTKAAAPVELPVELPEATPEPEAAPPEVATPTRRRKKAAPAPAPVESLAPVGEAVVEAPPTEAPAPAAEAPTRRRGAKKAAAPLPEPEPAPTVEDPPAKPARRKRAAKAVEPA